MRCLSVFALMGVMFAQTAAAPSWRTGNDLPNVDWAGSTPTQKASALKMMREADCTCACGMKVAQCRVEDPSCSYSKALSALMLKGFKDGKNPAEVAKLVSESAVGRPRAEQQILDEPIKIPTVGAPSTGPDMARIVLVEFSDFECPYCSVAAREIKQILAAYPKDIRLIYKQFPLSMHPHAKMAATASLAAQEQGKFWELHDLMFANFRQLSRENLVKWAHQAGMDETKFQAGLESAHHKTVVEKDLQDGEQAGVNGTPALFVNGKHYNGPITLAALKPILDQELKR